MDGGDEMIHGLSEEEKFKVIRPMLGEHMLGDYGMPIIHKTDEEMLDIENMEPVGIKNLTTKQDNSKKIVLPFTYDKDLLKYWTDPMKYIPRFQTVMAVGTPDYSIYPTMNINEVRHNVYMNRWLGCLWQTYKSEFINQPVRTLSLGQRMRADIAAALLHNPKVLFLDEPTIGLDVIVKDKIRQAIKKINSEQNTTIVLTTHDMLDIESLADKIIMIDKGKLAFQGSIEKLRSMYGEGKIITFKLTDVSDFSKLIQSIETSGIEAKITREDRQVSILFDASKNSISSFIINLLQSVNVNDIMLSDIGIDEIVKKAYSREV